MAAIDPEKLRKRFFTALIITPPCLFLAYYGGLPFMMLVAACFVISQLEWFNLAFKNNLKTLYYPGVLYIAVCSYSFLLIGMDKNFDALLLIILIASSDIGAYFAGKIIGGPKMAEKISPNKTMAGLGGAVMMPAIVLLCHQYVMNEDAVSLFLFLIFGGLIGLFGQLGDILISWSKRKAGVKDTGNILPGHGGLLDRIDSLLLASPVFIILEKLIGHV